MTVKCPRILIFFNIYLSVEKEGSSNLAHIQVNKGQPAPAQAGPHHMNNGSRPAPAAPPAPAVPAASAAPHQAPADVQKLQQQLQDIKEQVRSMIESQRFRYADVTALSEF